MRFGQKGIESISYHAGVLLAHVHTTCETYTGGIVEHRNCIVHAPEQFGGVAFASMHGNEASQLDHIDTIIIQWHGDHSQSGKLGKRMQGNRKCNRIDKDDAVQVDQHVQDLLQALRGTGGQSKIIANFKPNIEINAQDVSTYNTINYQLTSSRYFSVRNFATAV